MYTVKQVSELAGVSVRTLHYYDQIDLLKPTETGANGYRHYDDASLLRLQQILFYREIGLELAQIKAILDSPNFDLLTALRSHRAALEQKIGQMHHLIETVDKTILHLSGEADVSNKQLFGGFSEEKQKEYERLARLEYGPTLVNESVKRWGSYTGLQREAILEEGNQFYADLGALITAGKAPQSQEVQAILPRWHSHLRYFYEPTLEILRGLGDLYNTSPDFIANFQKLHPDLPGFMQAAVGQYVDDLEDAELRRLIAEDEADSAQNASAT